MSCTKEQSGLNAASNLLKASVPECFNKVFEGKNDIILPLICNLTEEAGLRRTDIENEIYFAYYQNATQTPGVTARLIAGKHIAAYVGYQLENGLAIERYTLAPADGKVPVTLDAIQNSFPRNQQEAVAEAYARLNGFAVANLKAECLQTILSYVLKAQTEDDIIVDSKVDGKFLNLTLAVAIPVGIQDFMAHLYEAAAANNYKILSVQFCEATQNANANDFSKMPVLVAQVMAAAKNGEAPAPKDVEQLKADIQLAPWINVDDTLHKELVIKHNFSLASVEWIRSAAEFIHGQLAFIDRNAYQYEEIIRFIALYPDLIKKIFTLFDSIFNPALQRPTEEATQKAQDEINALIDKINTGILEKNTKVKTIFKCILNYLECTVKSNFYCQAKTSYSCRLANKFTAFYRGLGDQYTKAFPQDIPFGVFFMHRNKAFSYQIRFTDIGRGGWRTVIPIFAPTSLEKYDTFEAARDEAYKEGFVLANTQHLKNKDIYEGGAKLLTLMEPVTEPALRNPQLWQHQRSFIRSFVSIINYDANKQLKDKAIIDLANTREIIEVGPDENMFDVMIEWMGNYAEKQGYTLGGGIISGKPDVGFNHKHYGVTSFGVLQYFLKTLNELGINPEKDEFTLKIAGGPGGDVAGNFMKLILADNEQGTPKYPNVKIIAITDGPAAAYDPAGLDRNEIKSLIGKANLDAYNPDKLKGEGATMVFSKPITENGETKHREVLVGKNGKHQELLIARDEFMRIFQNNMIHYTDVFVPGGGRPSTINETNWKDFFPENKPVFRAIVEGANSYITPGARDKIQEQGVWIVKDASANKCGVITSSYEIISGILLTPEEFRKVKEELVKQVMQILKARAQQEANWLYTNFKLTEKPMTVLTEKLSREINEKNATINSFLEKNPQFVTDELIFSHLPAMFKDEFADRLSRLPEEYKRAIASVELACRMVYKNASPRGKKTLEAAILKLMTEDEKKNIQ